MPGFLNDMAKAVHKSPKNNSLREDLYLNKSPSPMRDSALQITSPGYLAATNSMINLSDMGIMVEKPSMPAPEEPPYFPEKWYTNFCKLAHF